MVKNVSGRKRDFLFRNLIQIFKNEGAKGYFKGLPAVLIGTIPSRTIYFWAYNLSKQIRQDNGPITHIVSVGFFNIFGFQFQLKLLFRLYQPALPK